MFIGRERELKTLSERYQSGGFEFLTFYGRRRVGKTALIKEFIKDKKAIFFTAAETGKNHNLQLLSSAVFEVASDIESVVSFSSFEDVFDMIYQLAKKEKLVFVIDEYPYLAQSYKPISSLLQQSIDHKFKETDMFLILCGSSMSFMENLVLGYKSPLYGRRTGQLKIEPFNFENSAKFHKKFSKEEKAIVYGITGGIPWYLEAIDDSRTLKDNIIRNFFTPDTMLFEEPSNLLKQELREPQTYNDIIMAIAAGSSKISEIVTKANIENFDSSKCNKYLKSLLSLGIVKKEQPVFVAAGRKSIYRLKDGMFRFWYKFVPQNLSKIQLGLGRQVYSRIESQIPGFMGEVFEDICIEWLWRESIKDGLPVQFRDCGRWWGNNPIQKQETEIDILAFEDYKLPAIFCECKWKNEKTDVSVLDDLIDKSAIFSFPEKYYIIFSKSGFTKKLEARASERVMLVKFKDM